MHESSSPPISLKPGTRLIREWRGVTYTVLVQRTASNGMDGAIASLTLIAREITGAHWSGPRFFGLRKRAGRSAESAEGETCRKHDPPKSGAIIRCAIYTRKSSDEGLEQEFNSLDAQREACEAYITSQRHAGWVAVPDMYDDGGLSGGTMERPALLRLLEDVRAGNVNVIVV